MKCTLLGSVPKEHESMRDEKYGEIFMHCSLFNNRQICLWCCLHIIDWANPMNRAVARESHLEYDKPVTTLAGREWDEIWETCSKCSNK